MSLELARVNRLQNNHAGTDWPDTYHHNVLAMLQVWADGMDTKQWGTSAGPWLDLLTVACEHGELPACAEVVAVAVRGRRMNHYGLGHPPPIPQSPRMVNVTRYNVRAADFAAWMARQGQEPSALLAAWCKAQGVVVAEAQTPAPATAQEPVALMKKQALIHELRPQWPTIEADLKESSREGNEDLAAANVRHGMWDKDKALAWAKSRGKLPVNNVHSLPSVWPGAITRHQLKG